MTDTSTVTIDRNAPFAKVERLKARYKAIFVAAVSLIVISLVLIFVHEVFFFIAIALVLFIAMAPTANYQYVTARVNYDNYLMESRKLRVLNSFQNFYEGNPTPAFLDGERITIHLSVPRDLNSAIYNDATGEVI